MQKMRIKVAAYQQPLFNDDSTVDSVLMERDSIERKIEKLQLITGSKQNNLEKLISIAESKSFFQVDHGPDADVRLRMQAFDMRASQLASMALDRDPSLKSVGFTRVFEQVKGWMMSNASLDGSQNLFLAIIKQAIIDILNAPLDPLTWSNGDRGMFVDAICFLFDSSKWNDFLSFYGISKREVGCDPQGEVTEALLERAGLIVSEHFGGKYSFTIKVRDDEKGTDEDVQRAIAFFERKAEVLNRRLS